MSDAAAWKAVITLGTGVALAAGIAYAFLNQDTTQKPSIKAKKSTSAPSKSSSSSSSRSTAARIGRPGTGAGAGAGAGAEAASDDETEAENLRGYKQTKTGQTTTYFNRELSEKDKALLGDSTPKRIDTGAAGPSPSTGPVRLDSPAAGVAPAASPAAGSSAWNTAGTWEERDVTQWANDRLRALLAALSCRSSANGSDELTISSVTSLEGDASIAMARGKRKNIYDFTAELEWKVTSNGTQLASGTSSVGDITANCEHEIVCRSSQGAMSSSLKSIVQELALAKNSKLKIELGQLLSQ
jgi:hypothetical protein